VFVCYHCLLQGVEITQLDGRRSFPGRGKMSSFPIASIPALGPTQPPIQLIPWAISPEVNRSEREDGRFLAYVFMAWCLINYLFTHWPCPSPLTGDCRLSIRATRNVLKIPHPTFPSFSLALLAYHGSGIIACLRSRCLGWLFCFLHFLSGLKSQYFTFAKSYC
jgi:hypothetical protein